MKSSLSIATALLVATFLVGCGSSGGPKPAPDGGGGHGGHKSDAGTGGTTMHPDGGPTDAGDAGAINTCGMNGATQEQGQTCGCDSECKSKHCVEGVCCDTACTNGCQTCTAPDAGGTCLQRTAGTKPRKPSDCTADSPVSCGLDGFCDGAGACRNYGPTVTCQGGTCQNNSVVGAYACDGMGSCKPGVTLMFCLPYRCDATSGTCFEDCTDQSQCDSQHSCDFQTASCGKAGPGESCKNDDGCISGHCADGVCCNIACQGACVACNLPGRLGTCMPVDSGKPDPRAVCRDQGAASCGHNGTCDGVGGCANYARDTQCLQPSCTGNRLNTAGTCDGLGTCRNPGVQDCHPFRCADGECTKSCQTDHDCDTGNVCNNGSCGLKPPGAVCAAAGECASNYCVDGVCCMTACTGACQTCALPTSPGTCLTVAKDNADPHGICQDKGASSCGTNGKCDGTGSCETYAPGTKCADQTCTSGIFTDQSTCNTTGQCVAPDSRPCAPYVCNGTQCFNVCATSDQCKPPNTCDANNSCGLKGIGAVCGKAEECQTGLTCAQGYCCNAPCAGACQSCALPNSLGTCTNVPVNQVDPAGICQDKGSTSCQSNGKCDGNGSCQLYVAQTQCIASSCPAGASTFTGASTCDGTGNCLTPNAASCFPYGCGTGVCKNSCVADTDCASPAVCINGSCGLKGPGQACVTSVECMTGLSCAQGYCCTSACTGPCQSCGLPSSLGACTNVPNGTADPQATCHDQGQTSCGQDGFCDGNGACRKYAGGTSCAPPSCAGTGSTLTTGRTCDGNGTCQQPTTLSCAPYMCNAANNACKAACTADSDCLAPDICDTVTNLCGNKKRLGQSCTQTSECLTNNSCVDGVCCSSPSCGSCQACNISGSPGNCANVPASSLEPHGLCATNPPCGNTGACDGAGHCQLGGTSVACGAATCSGSTFTPLSHCNGSGACAAPTTSSCSPYTCTTSSCKTSCTADSDCVAPYTCQGTGSTKSCALKPNSQACASGNQCISGFCTDGVCCGSGPCGTCQACNVNGAGSCAPIPAGTAAPAGQCGGNGTCGNTGTCSGTGACTQASTGVACGAASCTGTTFTPTAFCTGSGACATVSTSSCAPYKCSSTSCSPTCNADTDCVPAGANNSYCTGTGGACLPVKATGVACLSNHECGTGNCVDGVCCGSASCPTCQACNVSGTPGACANVADGVSELHGRCGANGTCGNTGTCTGGACTQAPPSVSCTAASCSGSTFTPTAFCSGSGSCSTPTTASCAPYVCSGSSCASSCSSDTQCVPMGTVNTYCTGTNGSCLPVKSNGVACLSNHECGSGNCTDGVCCGSASCPTCQACNVSGSAGACANIPATVSEPHGRCAAGGTCGNTGACNGAGACTQASATVGCAPASCSGSTFTAAAFCSGGGSCAAPGSSCGNTCNADTDCFNDIPNNNRNYCTGTNGSCLPLKSNSVACLSSHECSSGFCVDGVCCGSSTCGTCMACNVGGSFGTCANVPNNITDPHARCGANGTCGNTGACNGSGACQQQPTSVQCSGPSCSGTTVSATGTLPAFCSGAGSCQAATTMSCGQYRCGAGACKTSCTVDTDCIDSAFCSSGACTSKLTGGIGCSGGNQCSSGFCTDGVCCNVSACTGTCNACNVNGSGTCTSIPLGQAAPSGQCATGAACGNTGTCNGASGCQQVANGTSCGSPASCGARSSQFQPASACNGAGACVPPSAVTCGNNLACTATGCTRTGCSQDADCANGYYCNGGSCAAQQTSGACTNNDQCATGFCTDGVCCNVASCLLSCLSCNVPGQQGTCNAVQAGGVDPTHTCDGEKQDASTCGFDGLCNGAGGCELYQPSAVCASSCAADGSALTESFCDGLGICNILTPMVTSCATSMCSSGPPPVCQ
jgi:hypothetical protein